MKDRNTLNTSQFKSGDKKAIIWDWNGTLLNDIQVCISCMNMLLQDRNIQQLTKETYRRIFTFPVKEYYKAAGIDFAKEPFEKPAMEFINLYHKNLHRAELFAGVQEVLKHFQQKGFHQSILSAMEHESLIVSLRNTGIFDSFNEISGIDNHYAHSKLEIGEELLERINYIKSEMLLIGDSLHDKEVADKLGIDYVLIANGHQSKERLINKTSKVLDKLEDVVEYLK